MENSAIKEKNKGWKKALEIISWVIVAIFAAFAIFAVTISVSSKKDPDGTATVFGTQLRFVKSDSMAECSETDVSQYEIKSIPVKSCVFVETIPEEEKERDEWLSKIKVGDVLTFKYVYTTQETITHRVTNIEPKTDGGYVITLRGDNVASGTGALYQTIDTSLTESPNYIIGKVTGQSYFLGLVIYAVKSPLGISLIIIVPSAIVIIWNAVRIAKVVREGKKEKALAEAESKEKEIEDLKRQLESLKSSSNNETENPKEDI